MIKKFTTDQSSVIKEIAYNSVTHNMRVIFKSGSVYIYEFVPENVFNEFITSESLGKYFGIYIKNRYIYKNVTPEKQETPKDSQPTFLDYLMNLINEA